jgi:hypothetical protein
MRKETLESLITRMDDAADKSGCASAFWRQVALVLIVWDDVKRGWMPVVGFDPNCNEGLRDLADAYRQFGSSLVVAANQRAFA